MRKPKDSSFIAFTGFKGANNPFNGSGFTSCGNSSLQAKSEQDAVKRLIGRVEQQENIKKERAEQKESDEYAQKQWYSKNSATYSTKHSE
ncbi:MULTISPECIES: flagellar FliJ family protein [Legionella]|uniref:flagellar FliJ family protein n=1 Tax=Legionella TaxID=445 RepID=UPI0015923FD2|nr:flagellar FliJ family protein [Legionella maceachernii]